jgi:aryl-alcohol dehydrogenase-like predicted oxidoreductase
MIRTKIQGIEKSVPQIAIGTAMPLLADDPARFGANSDRTEAFRFLDELWEMGLNLYDCASIYGEPVIGEYLAARKRHQDAVILTKCAHPNAYRKRVTTFDMESDLHDSLAKLKTDYIDIYVLHRDDPDVPVSVIVETLNKFHKQGKIGAFGGSNWSYERIRQANEFAAQNHLIPFTVSSPNYGLAHQVEDLWGGGCTTLTGPENEEGRKWYAQNNIHIFAYSSMARGFFSGKFKSYEPQKAEKCLDFYAKKGYYYPENMERLARAEQLADKYGCTVAKIAISWMFHQNLKVIPILSGSKACHYAEAIEAADIPLTADEVAWLDLR